MECLKIDLVKKMRIILNIYKNFGNFVIMIVLIGYVRKMNKVD